MGDLEGEGERERVREGEKGERRRDGGDRGRGRERESSRATGGTKEGFVEVRQVGEEVEQGREETRVKSTDWKQRVDMTDSGETTGQGYRGVQDHLRGTRTPLLCPHRVRWDLRTSTLETLVHESTLVELRRLSGVPVPTVLPGVQVLKVTLTKGLLSMLVFDGNLTPFGENKSFLEFRRSS